jgi:hypothetical protein
MRSIDPAMHEGREREGHDQAQRVLTDEEGHLWRVREVWFADTSPSLIFESEAGFRRVRVYPRNWHLLADFELYALSWRT